MVHDLVQQNGEVEDREPLDDGERNPDQRVLEPDQRPGRQRQDAELPHRDGEVPPRGFLVQLPHLLARDGSAQLSTERGRVRGVIVGLHGFTLDFTSLRRVGDVGAPASLFFSWTDRFADARERHADQNTGGPKQRAPVSRSPRNTTAVNIATMGTMFE